MTSAELVRIIAKLCPPFLEDLDPAAANTVLSAATQRRYLANSIITNQGHPASHLFMVLTGGTRSFYLTAGGHKLQMFASPAGEMFGGMALVLRRSEYVLSTEAVRETVTLVWERAAIRRLAERYPKLLDNALTIASDYLNCMIAAQVALTCHSARQRLAEALVNMASGVGRRLTSGIELSVRNDELAGAVGLTPFTVSRLMSEWQRNGLLRKSRGKVLLPNPERLLLHDI